jgi:DNA adenine methylase
MVADGGSGFTRPLSGTSFIKPPFGYFGAKQRLARRIVEMLPPHAAWVEAFCGSAAVTLNKPNAEIEIINDLDREIVNAFTVLRDQPDALTRAIRLTPYARYEYELAKSARSARSCLERARRFFVLAMMTVNGTSGSPGNSGFSFSDSYVRAGKEARVSRWHFLPERLATVVERLRSVRIENKDAREIVTQFSRRPATLIYLDPPYLTDRKHTYSKDANTEEFHADLLARCLDSNCMIMISGYSSPLYRKYLNRRTGWSVTYIGTKTRGTDGTDSIRREAIWTNQALRTAKRSGCLPTRLTRKEALEKKVNPERP